MILYPAIDLFSGKAVRLLHGDYDKMTVYSDTPRLVARDFAAAGATHIHLVDLEGAREGCVKNGDTVRAIKSDTGLFCEVGGGIRDEKTVAEYISAGMDRVILGTSAVTDPTFAARMADKYGEKIAVGIDIRDGFVAIKGWTEKSNLDAFTFTERMQRDGVGTLICTDISRDGAMRGTNRELYRDLSERFRMRIIASGGVSSLDDVRALAALGIHGAIIGLAYYTGDINLKEAIEVAK